MYLIQIIQNVKEGKFHPITGYEGLEGK